MNYQLYAVPAFLTAYVLLIIALGVLLSMEPKQELKSRPMDCEDLFDNDFKN